MPLDSRMQTLLTGAPDSKRAASRLAGEAWNACLDLLYPAHCAACNTPLPPKTNRALCLRCAEKIQWIGRDACRGCGDAVGEGSGVVEDCPSCRSYPLVFIHSACAAGKYAEGPLRQLILSLKFGGKIQVAEVLGAILAARIEATGILCDGMVLVPAPLTRKAAYARGYNQAEEIARTISTRLKLPLETRLLKKVRTTLNQATLSPQKRRENLKGAFACAPKIAKRYEGATILLIDDVITTGSTVSECARTLRDAGIKQIRAAAVARG